MKKIEVISVVGIVLISVLAFAISAIAQQSNVISIGHVEAPQGQSVTTPILIKNAVNITVVELNLSYDPAIVNVTDATMSDDFNSNFIFDNSHASDGYVYIKAYNYTVVGMSIPGVSGDATVANVELTAIGSAGTSDLNISILKLQDNAGNNVVGTTDNGTFTIQEDVNPPIVINPRAEPMIIPDDTDNEPLWGELAELMVNVTDESGIASVTVNLSDLGWGVSPMVNQSRCLQYGICSPSVAVLTCIGNYSADGTTWVPFNFSTNASAGTTGWNGSAYVPFCLPVNATDIYGNSNTSVCINLTVMKNGDVTSDGNVDVGDGVRIINHYFHSEDPRYSLPSDTIADVTGDENVDVGDGVRIINHYFHPEDQRYILK